MVDDLDEVQGLLKELAKAGITWMIGSNSQLFGSIALTMLSENLCCLSTHAF